MIRTTTVCGGKLAFLALAIALLISVKPAYAQVGNIQFGYEGGGSVSGDKGSFSMSVPVYNNYNHFMAWLVSHCTAAPVDEHTVHWSYKLIVDSVTYSSNYYPVDNATASELGNESYSSAITVYIDHSGEEWTLSDGSALDPTHVYTHTAAKSSLGSTSDSLISTYISNVLATIIADYGDQGQVITSLTYHVAFQMYFKDWDDYGQNEHDETFELFDYTSHEIDF